MQPMSSGNSHALKPRSIVQYNRRIQAAFLIASFPIVDNAPATACPPYRVPCLHNFSTPLYTNCWHYFQLDFLPVVRLQQTGLTFDVCNNYTVSEKNIPGVFSYNSRKYCRIFITFGRNFTEEVSNQNMLYFSISPN